MSKATILVFLAFSNTIFFLINIPLFIARFNAIANTLGTANPSAQGQEATRTPTPLYTIQLIPHVGT